VKDIIATKNADAIRMHWQVNEFDEVVFTHYFKSNCHPNCPEIVVKANADKVKSYVLEISRFLMLQDADIQPRSVKQVSLVVPYTPHTHTPEDTLNSLD